VIHLAGPYEGHTGALAWLGYLALAGSSPQGERRRQLGLGAVAAGVGQAVLGLWQFWSGAPPTGTLGHVMFLAGFLLISSLVTVGLFIGTVVRWQKWTVFALWLLQVAALMFSARRGPLIGLVVGLTVVTLLHRHTRALAPVLLSVPLLVVLALAAPTNGNQERLAERVGDTLSAVAVEQGHDTASQRLDFYRVAWRAALERPLLGHGFGSFRDFYASQRSQSIGRFEILVHNIGLDLLLSLGMCGVLAFAFLLRAFALSSAVTLRETTDDAQHALSCGIAGMAAAYAVFLTFNFDQPALGGWAFALGGSLLQRAKARLPRGTAGALALATAVLAVIPLWRVGADVLMGRGAEREASGQFTAAVEDFRRAQRMVPHECLYAVKLATTLRLQDPTATAPERVTLLEECTRREPRNGFQHHHLGLAFRELGGGEQFINRSRAIVSLARARDLAPGFASFRQALAQTLADGGDPVAALQEIDAAVAASSADAGLHNDRGNILVMLRRPQEALGAYARATQLAPQVALYARNHALVSAQLQQ